MRLDSKAVILGEKMKIHNMRPHSEGGENGGDAGDPEPGRDVDFSELMLTRKQFDDLVGEGAFNSFFNDSKNKSLEPAFTTFKSIKIEGKFKNSSATIVMGASEKEIELNGATIKGLQIDFPKACNERACAALSGTIQAIFPRNNTEQIKNTLELETYAGKEVKLSLRLGPAVTEEDEAAERDRQKDLVKEAREAEELERARTENGGDEARPH